MTFDYFPKQINMVLAINVHVKQKVNTFAYLEK